MVHAPRFGRALTALLDSPLGSAAVLLAALAIDYGCGEPRPRLHPVVWIGSLTDRLIRAAPARGRAAPLAWGAAIALLVPGLAAGAALLVSRALDVATSQAAEVLAGQRGNASHLLLGLIFGSELVARAWVLKTLFALRALRDAAFTVRDALRAGDLAGARLGLASLCSRDPRELDEPALVAAAIESIAENASDSIVAPLFYFLLLGLPGAALYRAVNTLDAMVGYRGRYEYLGKGAARFDDLLNLVPARLTALLLLAGGALAGADARSALRVLRRDARCTASPNAGWPMAAMAGLLGVALEKRGHYRLGEAHQPLRPETIDAAWRIVVLGVVVGTAVAIGVLIGAPASTALARGAA